MPVHTLLVHQSVDDEDTEVGPAPRPPLAVMVADTAEFDDTDRDILAQGTIDTSPQMFEDTGVVIINKPTELAPTDRFVVTFRRPTGTTFRQQRKILHVRASTAEDWPPSPRVPANRAPKHAAVYTIVPRPETNKN